MRYHFTATADLSVAANATGVLLALDASANAIPILETLTVGGRSASASDAPVVLQIVRNSGGSLSGGTSLTPAADRANHTAAIRATVSSNGPTITGGTDTVLQEIAFPPQGTIPLGVPGVLPVAEALPGEIIAVKVINPSGNGTITFRVSGTLQD